MASKITIKRSLTAAAPAGLSFGEMAFVQGSGLTANQLYVGISGGNPAWVGAQIGTTGTWTDNSAQTSLATQYAIEQRITSKISASTTGVSSFNGVTGAVTGVSSFNGLTGAVSGVTTSAANTFTQLNTFSAGISASGATFTGLISGATATFSRDITVNTMTVGLGKSSDTNNVAIGVDALASNTSDYDSLGVNNTAVGCAALSANTTGSSNVGVGKGTLSQNTTGVENVGVGERALNSNKTGNGNLGMGYNALGGNTLANYNVGLGYNTLSSNTSGSNNTGVGVGALSSNTTGSNKTAIGYDAGRYRGTATTNLTTGTGGIYIGYQARGSTLAQTNEIVIGVDALGLGSNTDVIGATLQSSATIYGVLNLPSGLSTTGATFTGNISAPNIVSSFNGLTGAVSGLTSGGPLGTPISGTLSNCTGYSINNLVTSPTTSILSVGTLELGDATDTTLARSGAGVVTIEGVAVVTVSAAQTLTNKTLTGATLTSPSLGTPTLLVGTNITGTASSFTAGSVTTNANLTGAITSVGNGTTLGSFSSAHLRNALTDETGTGVAVFGTDPAITTSLTTPSTSFDLLNTTATTVNFAGGASSALNIGNVGGTATFAGSVIVNGDFTVQGNTTTLNTTTLNVEDFNITMGLTLTSASQCTGAGIGIGVGTGITFAYDHSSLGWLSSVNMDLASGKVFKIANASVLSATTLGSLVVNSSLTSVGTLLDLTVTNTINGSVTGNAGTATTATNANNIAVALDSSDSTCFITFVNTSSGNQATKVNSTLTYNALSGELSATLIDGGTF